MGSFLSNTLFLCIVKRYTEQQLTEHQRMFVSKGCKHRKHLVACACSALSAPNMEFKRYSNKTISTH